MMTRIDRKRPTGMELFCALTLIALLTIGLAGQSLRQRHEEILRFVEKGELAQAEAALVELRDASAQLFARNSYGYLLGTVKQRLGKPEAAAEEFLSVVERQGVLREYGLWHLSQIARADSKLKLEQQVLNRLLTDYPDSLLRDRARRRVAESYREDENYQKAIAVYQTLAQGKNRRAREARLRIGMAERSQGKAFQARATLKPLLIGRSISDTALRAAEILDQIDRRVGTALSLNDHLRRARVYQVNRAFEPARRHYQWLVNHFPTSRYVPEALWAIGLAYYREEKNDEAISWLARLADRYPATPQGKQAAYWIGHAQARAGRWLKAVERYERVIASNTEKRWLEGAHLNAIDALRSAGRNEQALEMCRRTIRRFPGELAATTALFSQARLHLVQQDQPAALRDFEALLRQNLNRRGPRAPNRPEVTYWRGRCLEQLGRTAEALKVYLGLPQERGNYYGFRATARLRALMGNPETSALARAEFEALRRRAQSARAAGRYPQALEAATQALRLSKDEQQTSRLFNQLKQIYLRLPGYRQWRRLRPQGVARGMVTASTRPGNKSHGILGSELAFLGLYDEGAFELEAALRSGRRRLTRSQLYTLAVAFNRGGHPNEAIRIGEANFESRIPKDYRLELLPHQLVETLYPVPYRLILDKHSAGRTIDPRFVLALMRQESRFRADAKSPAAARGLMQFIPSTAEDLASALDKDGFGLDDLYDADTAIEFGLAHLEELLREFPNNLFAVAAAYNAGQETVRRWLERARSPDPDRFVIEIAYRQTKEYVYRVMTNFWAYQQIVSQKLETEQ